MKIWIENKIGYLEGYSTMEQPDTVELEVEQEPLDFMNWRYDGARLIHDEENAPKPEPVPPTDVDLLKKQNAILTLQVAEANEKLAKSNKITAQIMLKIEELEKKVGSSNE